MFRHFYKNNKLVALMICCFPIVSNATGAGAYFGIGLGSSNVNNDARNVKITDDPPAYEYVTPSNTGMAERLFLGFGINQYAAMEFGYTHYAPSEYDPTQYTTLSSTPQIRENAIDLTAKGMYPFERINIFAKLGLAYVRQTMSGSLVIPTEPSTPTTSPPRTGTTNYLRPTYGIGASLDLTPRWVVDVSFNRVMSGGSGFENADFLAVSISYHFVKLYCGQFLC